MTAKVLKFPGAGCRHYLHGRCLYEEHLNPGFRRSYRCGVLEGWEAQFESFVDRAEAFGIGQAQAGGLWSRRFEGLVSGRRDCAEFIPEADAARSESEPMGCALFMEGFCLIRLPRCQGVCPRHEPAPSAAVQAVSASLDDHDYDFDDDE